ncbi:D-serine deaminase, pyridoxal phosphate-dependent [Arachidicoccus rhizosphaerae]|uniref:D-serine deaminase, pyridoxal phosphate-dependent n=1 Tax=Arachidicoccus rhizosphaerae TaxID=551991 RepID=A0A1H4BIW8_9BACT|nr:D-TA family PLP-dependent enzyme [Arachidicoccus rhizosphaerae]SEA48099.1 D-serine deaminase, pyridoxal phosphate-dependent [Arachidicoccus rhizosphaerae]
MISTNESGNGNNSGRDSYPENSVNGGENNPKRPWYLIEDTRALESPALVIYYDRLIDNIRRIKKMVGDDSRIRPHVKTSKMPAVCRILQQHYITRFKCATIAEAEMLAQLNAEDVLLAYPLIGPDLERWLQLLKRYNKTHFSCLVSNLENARHLNSRAKSAAVQLGVYVDIDAGMHRTGIAPDKAAFFIEELKKLSHVQLIGLHVYDGHLKIDDPVERQAASDELFVPVKELLDRCNRLRATPLKLIIGGSPSFSTHIKRQGAELSPGTFVFWDQGYAMHFKDLPFEPAAVIITRVIDHLDNGTCTVDMGTKAIASEMPFPRARFLNAPDLQEVFQSEEHLNLRLKEGSTAQLPPVGSLLYAVPFHICPTVALYDHAWVIKKAKVADQWQVQARKRKINF